MRKRILLTAWLLLISINAQAATYYVKTAGNDSNAGTSDGAAWKTLSKANTGSTTNDTIYLNKGDVWWERITTKTGQIYSAYGSGALPKVYGSALDLSSTGSWTSLGSNLWSAQITSNLDVGNLIFNVEGSAGVKKSSIGAVTAQGDFFYDSSTTPDVVKMYSTSNPGSFYIQVIAAVNQDTVSPSDNSTIEYIDFRYAGAHAINFSSDGVTVRHNSISWIGGSYLSPGVRYGNAIQLWRDVDNAMIEGNTIDNVYDAGITPQGTGADSASNIRIINNNISRCEYSIEFWYSSGTATNINMDNNTLTEAGGGWAHNQRPDGVSGHHYIGFPNGATCTNCTFKNNIMDTATEADIRIILDADLLDVARDYNLYYNSGGHLGTRGTVNQVNYDTIAALRAGMGGDANSINADPALDVNLQINAASAAYNAGTALSSVTNDIAGTQRPQGVAYDIGSFEYVAAPVPTQHLTWSKSVTLTKGVKAK